MVEVRCRPIDVWNGPRTKHRARSPYGVRWDRSLMELERELEHLGARDVVIGIDAQPSQIRIDGWPKGGVAIPPPVVLTFDSRHGPLRYQCDRWDDWRGNLRAITLVLQRQRLVNEAGVGQADQVYRGFSALPPGIVVGAAMSLEQAADVLARYAWPDDYNTARHRQNVAVLIEDPSLVTEAYRLAAKATHPDQLVDAPDDAFTLVARAKEVLTR